MALRTGHRLVSLATVLLCGSCARRCAPEDSASETSAPEETGLRDTGPWEGAPEGFLPLARALDVQIVSAAGVVPGDFTGNGVQDYMFWYATGTLVEGPLPSVLDVSDPDNWYASIRDQSEEWSSFGLTGGDHNGDGIWDVAISSYLWNDEDTEYYVFLYEGPIDRDRELSIANADASLVGAGILNTGIALSFGDCTGDGDDELLIGAPDKTREDRSPGAAYLVRGPLIGSTNLADATTILEGEEGTEGAGRRLSLAGDYDGDGIGDALIVSSSDRTGGLYLFQGPPPEGTISLADGDSVLTGSPMVESDDLSQGDLDGDGHDDVVVGDGCGHGACAGALWVFLGPLPAVLSSSDAALVVRHEEGNSYFGHRVSLDHDLDADGRDDLVAGASDDRSSDRWIGGVYVFYGPASGTLASTDADAVIKGAREDGEPDVGPGAWIAPAGDVNADGFDDLYFTGVDAELGSGAFIVFGGVR